jgi:signal transduction histidine kinase
MKTKVVFLCSRVSFYAQILSDYLSRHQMPSYILPDYQLKTLPKWQDPIAFVVLDESRETPLLRALIERLNTYQISDRNGIYHLVTRDATKLQSDVEWPKHTPGLRQARPLPFPMIRFNLGNLCATLSQSVSLRQEVQHLPDSPAAFFSKQLGRMYARLTATLHHEFRNSLTPIHCISQLLKKEGDKLPKPLEKRVDTITQLSRTLRQNLNLFNQGFRSQYPDLFESIEEAQQVGFKIPLDGFQ